MLRKLQICISPFLIILISILIFFAKNLFLSKGTFIGGIDVSGYFYWTEEFIKESLLSGSLPLWNPYYYSGHPFLANPSTFVFYPTTLFYVLFPLPWAFNLDTIFHIFIAAVGMLLFVRLITDSLEAGIASAIVYCFSGYFIERIFAGHITLLHAAALIPLIFYFTENALKTKKIRGIVLSGILLGVQVLGGDPQVSYYTTIFLALYFFIRIMSDSDPISMSGRLKKLSFFLLIPLIAFGISALQIFPSMEFRSLSERSSNTFEFATFMSFSPIQFYLLLVPKPLTNMLNSNWEFGCYAGVLSLPLMGIGLFFSRLKQYTLSLGIMVVIAITFVLGSNTPFYYLYFKLLPLLPTFRVPARCMVILVFLMAALVGLGIHYLLKHPLTRNQYLISTCGILLLLGFLFLGAIILQIPISSRGVINAGLFLVCSLILLNLKVFLKNHQIIICLFLFILFADLYVVYSPFIPKMNVSSYAQRLPFEQIFEKDKELYRVNVPGFGSNLYGVPARGMKYHYFGINGNTPIILKDYFDFIYNMAMIPQPTIFRHTFIEELFSQKYAFSSKILGVKYAIVESPQGYSLAQAKWYMPRALLIHNAIVIPEIEEHLAYMKDSRFDPTMTLLLEKDHPIRYESSPSGTMKYNSRELAEINTYTPNMIGIKTYSKSNAYLLLSELYYPGWKAYMDGKKVPILRADYLLRAIPLPPGEHLVTFLYRPVSLYQGLALSFITILVIGYFSLSNYSSNRKIMKGK